ncbi:MAG: hypothetical protein LBT44_03580 [Clostridiales bacterium]|jgi:hypothetical protein|nr:hypothetical protein [Clostridiales bacterium]
MKTYKIVHVEQKELDSVVCNMCGKIVSKNRHGYIADSLSVEKTWSYESSWDGETHSFDLCMDCYRNLINAFTVKIARSTEP